MSVCRLCSASEQLTDMFGSDLSNSEEMRFYFLLATGLHIQQDDTVSKMVCHRCCEIAIKLHRYRANAVANDRLLKEQCGQAYAPPATDQDELRRLSAQILTSNGKMFATPYGIPSDGKLLLVDPKNTASNEALELLNICIKPEPVESIPEPYKHDSVKELYSKYPGIILPKAVYKCHVSPVVTLDEGEVIEWAEEEFKRVQQKLSFTNIILKKIRDTSTNKDSINETTTETNRSPQPNQSQQTNQNSNTTIEKKRPGPKSKTLDVVENNKLLTRSVPVVKTRPGPKSKTVDVIKPADAVPKDKVIANAAIVHDKPGPKSMKREISKPLYRPGPKSRKEDLVIQHATAKPVVHEPRFVKATEKPASVPKLLKIQPVTNKIQALKDTINSKLGPLKEVPTSTQDIIPDNMDYSDDDFDPSSDFMGNDNDLSNSDSEPESFTSSLSNANKVDHSKNEQHSRRSGRTAPTIRSDAEYDIDFRDTHKTRLARMSDKRGSKRDSRSLRSNKRAASIESGKSDKSAKRRRSNSKSENDNKIESNNKTNVDSSNKTEVRSSKPDLLTKSNIPKMDESKRSLNKEELPKKIKHEIAKSLEKKETTKTIVNDMKELNNSKRELSKSTVNNKKMITSTPVVPQKIKTPDNSPRLLIARGQQIYMCHTCCKMFSTNKELSEHQKSHLICQYCNYRMKNLETLKKHQSDNCRMNVNRKQATLKLTKVDEIKSIVNQYPKAFNEDDDNSVTATPGHRTNNVTTSQMLPVQSTPQPTPPVASQLPILKEIKSEVVCISDESEDEVVCVDPSSEPIALPTSFLELPLSGMTENDMIRSLFTKHLKAGVCKFQRASQTFLPRASDVKYTNSNLIVLENLFDELYTYKIPVQLEIRPKISVRFTGEIVPPPKASLECWAHIKAITITKPKPALAPKPVWIAPAKLQTPSSILSKSDPANANANVKTARVRSPTPILTAQPLVVTSNVSQTNLSAIKSIPAVKVLNNGNIFGSPLSILASTENVVDIGGQGNLKTIPDFLWHNGLANAKVSVIDEVSSLSSPSLVSNNLPTTQAVVMTNNPSQTDTNNMLLNNLLNSSPSVPVSGSFVSNSNLFVTSNSLVPNLNATDKNPRLVSLIGNSSTSSTNMTTTLIQTSNNGTLFMQNGISPSSTTIIQTPNNATVIQAPNTAVIQTGNSTTFITPDSTSSNSVNVPVSAHNSMVLMQTVPQVPNQNIVNGQINTINNNLIYQTPTEQIYQISHASSNVNKVVVFSNTLSNGLQQNMPLYATPYLSNFPESSVSIEEIEDNPQNNDTDAAEAARNLNKTMIRVKPSWELY